MKTINLREIVSNKKVVVVNHPTGKAIQVFDDGKVIPSIELVDEFKLDTDNTMDIFDSKDWAQFPEEEEQSIIVNIRPKDKVAGDLFNKTKTTFKKKFKPNLDLNRFGGGLFTLDEQLDFGGIEHITVPKYRKDGIKNVKVVKGLVFRVKISK